MILSILSALTSKGVLVLIIISIGTVAYLRWEHLIEQRTLLQAQIQQQNDIILEKDKDIKKIQENLINLLREQTKLEVDKSNLQNRVSRIDNLVSKKPGLIETRINKGTNDQLRCLEIATGAELNEQEKLANKPSLYNSICPSLANPLYKP